MAEWIDVVKDLVDQIRSWVPAFKASKVEVSDLTSGDIPILEMEVAGGTLLRLEPARFAFDLVPTVLNLYAYPTLRRVRLVGPFGGAWEVQSSEGVAMNYRWDKEDFVRLLTELANESVSSRV